MIKKGQVMLEVVVVFIIILLFFIGITNICWWADTQIVNRQNSYDSTRLAAGANGSSLVWPAYTKQDLDEEWVVSD